MAGENLAKQSGFLGKMVRPAVGVSISAPDGGTIQPLPASWEECTARGWDQVDVVLVSGDAYIDHPSFGIALIGRLLESHGYRVAILAQPRYDRLDDFLQFGPPRLFWGISGGNLDSIVANYSGNGKVRSEDAYSPGGNPWRDGEKGRTNRRRPDRASLIYANLAHAASKGVPIILGGVEASLRRFVHYDYKQQKLRASLLSDAKADLLIYGMGERAVVEAAARLAAGQGVAGIQGSCERLTDAEFQLRFPEAPPYDNKICTVLPSWEDMQNDKRLFMTAERLIDAHARGCLPTLLVQRQQSAWLVQHPSAAPLSTSELDQVYELPYTRMPHPATPDIPAYRMICHSLTIVRGCSGNCSFCAITRHQGPAISSRSRESLVREAVLVSRLGNFSGTISDLGGPTANLYGTSCKIGSCRKHDCLFPRVCPNLQVDEPAFLALLRDISTLEGVRHVFVSSGLRMALLLKTPRLLREIIRSHTPGSMKIAPEHTEEEVLTLMHKEPHQCLVEFVRHCREVAAELGKKIVFTPYLIASHPGCTSRHTEAMMARLAEMRLPVKQFQDFTPTPGTLSTAMYVTGLHRDKDTPIEVVRHQSGRREQRGLLERRMTGAHAPKEQAIGRGRPMIKRKNK